MKSNKIQKKISSKKGFSLAEALVALAIVSLLTVLVATAVPVGVSMYKKITTGSEASSLCGTLSLLLSDELRYAKNITNETVGEELVATFNSNHYGIGVSVGNDGNGHIAIGADASNMSLIMGEKSYTGLQATETVTYDEAKNEFEVQLTITKKDDDNILASANFQISPINVARK